VEGSILRSTDVFEFQEVRSSPSPGGTNNIEVPALGRYSHAKHILLCFTDEEEDTEEYMDTSNHVKQVLEHSAGPSICSL
jgi:hypothetical protein